MGHPVRDNITDRVAARIGRKAPLIPPSHLPQTVEYLRVVFLGLLAGVSVIALSEGLDKAGDALGVHDDRQYAEASAHLTAGERALVQGVFGPDFATGEITKYFHRTMPPNQSQDKKGLVTLAYVLGGNTRDIHFVSTDKHARDYSRVPDQGYRASTFMHEMTHIWQHRQGMSKDCDIYDYTLTDRSHFGDFCNEQQATIIGDYTRLFLQPDNALGQVASVIPQVTYRAQYSNLIRVVEEQFPHARTARMAMQTRIAATAACTVAARKQAIEGRMQYRFDLRDAWAHCTVRHITTLNGERLDAMAAAPVLPAQPRPRDTATRMRMLWAKTLG